MTAAPVIGETLCSGLGAPELAAPWVDWRMASEIEDFPRAVLAARHEYRDDPAAPRRLWGDFTTLDVAAYETEGRPLPALIVAGTPCQAFSLAGARDGLGDPRGALTLAFVEHCHGIRATRLATGRPGPVVLWENVVGVLSHKNNPFGCFVAGLVGADAPLHPPGGEGWPR